MKELMQREEAAKAKENVTKDFATIIENLAKSRARNTSVRRPRKVHGNHKLSYDANRDFPEKSKEMAIEIGRIAKIFNFSIQETPLLNDNQNSTNFTNPGKAGGTTRQRMRPQPPKKKPLYELA